MIQLGKRANTAEGLRKLPPIPPRLQGSPKKEDDVVLEKKPHTFLKANKE